MLLVALQIVVSIVGLTFPGLLHHEKFPSWLNSAVAFVILLMCSVFMTQVGGKLTGNTCEDVVLYLLIGSSLLIGPLKPFVEDLEKIPVFGRVLAFEIMKDKSMEKEVQEVVVKFRLDEDTRIRCHVADGSDWRAVTGGRFQFSHVTGQIGSATPIGRMEIVLSDPDQVKMLRDAKIGQMFEVVIRPSQVDGVEDFRFRV